MSHLVSYIVMYTKSLSGAKYLLTFIDDHTRYVCVYVLEHKDQVFEMFVEWKAIVQKSTDRKLKVLCTDNGSEYMSAEFLKYLKTRVHHELTVPQTPEQNGVAERMNRTLVEKVRSCKAATKVLGQSVVKGCIPESYKSGQRKDSESLSLGWVKNQRSTMSTIGCTAYTHVPKD